MKKISFLLIITVCVIVSICVICHQASNNVQTVYIQFREVEKQIDDTNGIKKILNKFSVYDTPSCTFSETKILLRNKQKTDVFCLAVDGCHIIKKNDNHYIYVNDDEWNKLTELLHFSDV